MNFYVLTGVEAESAYLGQKVMLLVVGVTGGTRQVVVMWWRVLVVASGSVVVRVFN